uniref:WAP domain-containing protein n=1 Tax=Anolis carolinensis TaxID=28377 RepID=A0A803SZY1_ANOCA
MEFPSTIKLGICPRNPFRCTIPGHNMCNNDYDCEGRQKCCYFNCGKICRNPQAIIKTLKRKHKHIPIRKPHQIKTAIKCRMLDPPNNCDSDYQCINELKCCEGMCGRDCVKPIFGTIDNKLFILC